MSIKTEKGTVMTAEGQRNRPQQAFRHQEVRKRVRKVSFKLRKRRASPKGHHGDREAVTRGDPMER